MGTRTSLDRSNFFSNKSLGEALVASIKNGLIAFLALLLSLSFFEYIRCLIQAEPIKILDSIDLAIAFLGFLLMFAGKLLERLYGKY